MIAFALRLLGGPFGAAVLWGAGALLVAMTATIGVQHVQKAGLRVEVAEAKAVQKTCEAALQVQNAEVARIGKDCKAKADKAVADAIRALDVPEPPAAGAGAEHLNRWLKERVRAR